VKKQNLGRIKKWSRLLSNSVKGDFWKIFSRINPLSSSHFKEEKYEKLPRLLKDLGRQISNFLLWKSPRSLEGIWADFLTFFF
jgi:hypothetical protein